MLTKITNYLILIFLFLLPWQTRWIYGEAFLNNRAWEYGTLSFYGTEILMWFIIIFTGVRLFANKEFWKGISKQTPWFWQLFVFAFGVALIAFGYYSYAVSPAKEVSVQFMSRLIGSICLMTCLARSDLGFKKMALAFWGGGAVQAILAIWQFFSQIIPANKWLGLALHNASDIGASVIQTADERWLRAYGAFGSPNSLGIFLAIVFILGILLYARIDKKFQSLFLAGQSIIVFGLILSFSRNAWLAVTLGIITMIILTVWKKQKDIMISVLKNSIIGILLLMVSIYLLPNLFLNRLQAQSYLERLSFYERAAQYDVVENIIANNIFFGVGPGMYTYYLADNFEVPSYGLYEPVHNIYLLALAELGAFIFVFFAVGLAFLIIRLYKINQIYAPVVLVLLCFGLFDHCLWTLFTGQALFWAIFGLGLAKNN